MSTDQFRIGIVGGMGPQAGVLLQQYIIEETPADRDQEHLPVLTFTNPHIPDRTQSLRSDDGQAMVRAIVDSIQVLERSGASVIALPCITAHARFAAIQEQVSLPIVDMVQLIVAQLSSETAVGLLATNGTIKEALLQNASTKIRWVLPEMSQQQEVMDLIYSVKSSRGIVSDNQRTLLQKLVQDLRDRGANIVVLGCTELSVIYSQDAQESFVLDPLRLLAVELTRLSAL